MVDEKLPAKITEQPIYMASDLALVEAAVARRITDTGYNSCTAGFLLRECPPYVVPEWRRWWRDGWRRRSEEERRLKRR
jgi:hypothetical protein